jgi:uncharacterized protein YggU (UPF0235/DUF167 family)
MARISVKVKPGCRQASRLEKQEDGSYVAFLHARAHDGEANTELMKLLSKELGVAKTQITIASGAKGRDKIIEY